MIKYLKHHQINKALWDDCIDRSVNSLIYAYSWYLDIACPEWDALIEDNYSSIFPLTKAGKYGIKYLFQPFFAQQLGLFSVNPLSDKLLSDFLQNIPSEFHFIEIAVNSENKSVPSGFDVVKNINCELNLNSSYETIYSHYSTNAKRNLAKAKKSDLTINNKADINDIITLFRQNRGKEITKLSDRHYLILLRLIETCIQKGKATISSIYSSRNKLTAAAVFLKTKKRNIFLFSGSDIDSKENGAMFLLIDNFIKQNSAQDSILDFEGSNNPNLAKFYNGFGAIENSYYLIKKNSLPLFIKFAVNFIKQLKKQ